MRITIANMGPVRRIAVDLRDLTVFTGPNNCGKSVISTVLYATLTPGNFWLATLAETVASRAGHEVVQAAEELGDGIRETRARPELTALPEHLRSFLERGVADALAEFGVLVLAGLERAYGAPVETIRRKKNRVTPGRIDVESAEPPWSLSIDALSSGPRTTVGTVPSFERLWGSIDTLATKFRNRPRHPDRTWHLRVVVEELLLAVFDEFPEQTNYLPAARSGMMQSQKLLAGTVVRQAAWAGVRDVSIAGLSGVAADFLGDMIELDAQRDGELQDLGAELEKAVLGGEVVVAPGSSGARELIYRTGSGEFPIPRTSSMVSELAPIVLLLKHAVGEGSTLIVEEPEAHLHPESQVELATVLVKAANRGLRLLLTTHSEFFLQQLTNAIAASAVDSAEAGVPAAETILADRVSAYWFAPTDNGVVGEPLPVTVEEGIPEESFSAVAERLHNQHVRLELARDESA